VLLGFDFLGDADDHGENMNQRPTIESRFSLDRLARRWSVLQQCAAFFPF